MYCDECFQPTPCSTDWNFPIAFSSARKKETYKERKEIEIQSRANRVGVAMFERRESEVQRYKLKCNLVKHDVISFPENNETADVMRHANKVEKTIVA